LRICMKFKKCGNVNLQLGGPTQLVVSGFVSIVITWVDLLLRRSVTKLCAGDFGYTAVSAVYNRLFRLARIHVGK
jgi:hypothetical protein